MQQTLTLAEMAAALDPLAALNLVEIEEENHVVASPEKIAEALEVGGRAAITVRSYKTGAHVKIVLIARKKKPAGGWVSRATTAGRVGFSACDALEARDPEREYPDNYVGRFYRDTGEWKAGQGADAARVFAAEMLLSYVYGDREVMSEVFLATTCSVCGKKLDDPTSIERGVGPECFGKLTGSKHASYTQGT